MIDDIKAYSEELSETGRIISDNLKEFLSGPRALITKERNPLFADNAILHGIYMFLSRHLTYIICRSRDETDPKKIDEIIQAVQREIGKTIHKLMGDHMGADTKILFFEREAKEGDNHEKEEGQGK